MAATVRFVLCVGVLVTSMVAWPAGQDLPRPPGAGALPPQAGTGFIAGQVVDAVSGRPVPAAQVLLLPRALAARAGRGAAQLPILTDAQGRFFFRNLGPGTYGISASRAGYAAVRQAIVDVADSERVLDARVRLTKLAAINGALRDAAGDPVVGTEVIVFQRIYMTGRLALQPANRVRSDDRGMYRIPNLPPGEYLVCACLRDPIPFDQLLLTTLAAEPFNLMSLAGRALTSGSDVVSLDDTVRAYAPTFHPSSRSMAQATLVKLDAGEDKTGVDITAELVRATRVSGRIVGAQAPLQASSARLIPQADADAGIQITGIQPLLMQADGRFDFANVPPGQYRLIVVHRETSARGGGPSGLALNFTGGRAAPPPPPIALAGPGVTPPPVLWANETIAVGDRGISGLTVALAEGLSVNGRVQFVGSAPQPSEQLLQRSAVTLQQVGAPAVGLIASASGPVAANGSFKAVGAAPGKYSVSFTGAPGYSNLKAASLGGVDVLDLPIEIGQRDPGELMLTYVDVPAASITVTAPVQPGRQPDEDIAIVFPVDRRYWTDPLSARRRFKTQQMSTKGTATIADLPAGDYFVLVDPNFVVADWREATLDEMSRRAQRVTVGDGEKRTVEVRR